MKKWYWLVVWSVVIFNLFFSVALAQMVVIDDRGREVRIEQIPQRWVSLSPSNTEMVFALSLEDKLVGVTTYCNFPPEAEKKEKVGTITDVNLEKLISLEPDLVLASSLNPPELVEKLENLAFQVLVVEPRNITQVLDDLEKLAQIGGVEKEGHLLRQSLEARIESVTSRVAHLPQAEKPRVLHLIWHDPLWTAGKGTFIHQFITLAGGVNVASDLTDYATLSVEELLLRNPEIITVVENHGSAENLPYQFITTDYRFSSLAAVREGKVFRVDADIVSRPGPRVVEALELFARIIHPELFSPPEGE